jgi:hypothetical protein
MRALWKIALLTVTLALPVHAMQLDPDGLGQVLIYPYFTAQEDGEGNAFNTYLSIVNNTKGAKALRVRFREGRNGRELISFNLLVGPYDTWTAAVVPRSAGAAFKTTDSSCTAPGRSPRSTSPTRNTPGRAMTAWGTIPNASARVCRDFRDGIGRDGGHRLGPAPKMTCEQFRATSPTGTIGNPTGGLAGTVTLINVQSGLDFTVNAVAIADFANAAYYRAPEDPYPDYTVAEAPPVAALFYGDDHLYRTTWDTPLQAVNALLMAYYVANEVVMDLGTRSGTDFIITMPTRRLTGTDPPFTGLPANSRDIRFDVGFTDREGVALHMGDDCNFICTPGEQAHLVLPGHASVLSFRSSGSTTVSSAGAGVSDVLGSRNAWRVELPTTSQNGSVAVLMDGNTLEAPFPHLHHRIYPGDGTSVDVRPTYWGLPVVGFMVRTFRNGNLACGSATCQGNYGGAFPHRYVRTAYPP